MDSYCMVWCRSSSELVLRCYFWSIEDQELKWRGLQVWHQHVSDTESRQKQWRNPFKCKTTLLLSHINCILKNLFWKRSNCEVPLKKLCIWKFSSLKKLYWFIFTFCCILQKKKKHGFLKEFEFLLNFVMKDYIFEK